MKSPNCTVEKEQEWNLVVLRDVVDRIKSRPLTKEQEEKVREYACELFWATMEENK
ncbi:hypothetical protein HMPREF9130_0419 [Peptoniphilus sp. oral taxon 375 str. F0436]|nr:hypothetical protein HMPREF9130_0419 [Peptoniphilus sp. oral taxon 375 str. F0436]